MKLAQCNKIDSRNAFRLDLIDGLSSLITNSDEMNFGLATTALDAGTKIYVNRVDCVYTDAQKVSNSLVTMQNKGKGKNDDGGDDQDEPMDDQDGADGANNEDDALVPKQKKKTIARRTGKTLASSVATLDTDKIATNPTIDPLFHMINQSHDIGNVNSMLLANLDPDVNGCLILDSNSNPGLFSPSDQIVPSSHSEEVDCRDLFDKLRSICEDPGPLFDEKFFSAFTFDRNSPLETTGRFEDPATQPNPSKYAFDLNAEPIECENFAPPDFNLSHEEGFGAFSDDEDADSDDGNENVVNRNRTIITTNNLDAMADLRSMLANATEYSYFAKNINVVGSWAGPGFWKPNVWMKLRQRQADRLKQAGQDETNARAKRAAKKKEFDAIDFSTCPDHQLAPSKKHTFALITLTKWKKGGEALTLPRSVEFDPECQLKMNLKPGSYYAVLDKSLSKTSKQTSQASQASNHSVSGISSPPPDTGFDVEDEIPFPPESQPIPDGFLPTQDTEGATRFTGNNLVDAPDPLNQIVLPYAKQAKRMDVKKLKREMLDLIKAPTALENTLPIEPSSSHHQPDIIYFKQLYSQLPCKLPPSMAKDMSPQIAFVTLLHLANENVSTISFSSHRLISSFSLSFFRTSLSAVC